MWTIHKEVSHGGGSFAGGVLASGTQLTRVALLLRPGPEGLVWDTLSHAARPRTPAGLFRPLQLRPPLPVTVPPPSRRRRAQCKGLGRRLRAPIRRLPYPEGVRRRKGECRGRGGGDRPGATGNPARPTLDLARARPPWSGP